MAKSDRVLNVFQDWYQCETPDADGLLKTQVHERKRRMLYALQHLMEWLNDRDQDETDNTDALWHHVALVLPTAPLPARLVLYNSMFYFGRHLSKDVWLMALNTWRKDAQLSQAPKLLMAARSCILTLSNDIYENEMWSMIAHSCRDSSAYVRRASCQQLSYLYHKQPSLQDSIVSVLHFVIDTDPSVHVFIAAISVLLLLNQLQWTLSRLKKCLDFLQSDATLQCTLLSFLATCSLPKDVEMQFLEDIKKLVHAPLPTCQLLGLIYHWTECLEEVKPFIPFLIHSSQESDVTAFISLNWLWALAIHDILDLSMTWPMFIPSARQNKSIQKLQLQILSHFAAKDKEIIQIMETFLIRDSSFHLLTWLRLIRQLPFVSLSRLISSLIHQCKDIISLITVIEHLIVYHSTEFTYWLEQEPTILTSLFEKIQGMTEASWCLSMISYLNPNLTLLKSATWIHNENVDETDLLRHFTVFKDGSVDADMAIPSQIGSLPDKSQLQQQEVDNEKELAREFMRCKSSFLTLHANQTIVTPAILVMDRVRAVSAPMNSVTVKDTPISHSIPTPHPVQDDTPHLHFKSFHLSSSQCLPLWKNRSSLSPTQILEFHTDATLAFQDPFPLRDALMEQHWHIIIQAKDRIFASVQFQDTPLLMGVIWHQNSQVQVTLLRADEKHEKRDWQKPITDWWNELIATLGLLYE